MKTFVQLMVVLIDGSYLIYSTYFNSNYLFKTRYPNFSEGGDNYDWSINADFMNIFKHTLKKNLRKLKKEFGVSYKEIIFVRDCLRETIWRLDIYDRYKCDRKSFVKHKNTKLDLGNMFIEIYNEILPKISELTGVNVIKFETAEADDVIFLLSKLFNGDGVEVDIISNDSDFHQLCSDMTHVYDISLKKCCVKNTKNNLLFKILKGDRSDNVKGLRVNRKTFNFKNVVKLLQKRNNLNIFLRNRQLIDGNYIPFNIKKEIMEFYLDKYQTQHVS